MTATTLAGLGAADFWQLGGNAGTTAGTHFLGTTDNQPLELKVNATRGWRLEPTVNDAFHSGILNVVGGSPANIVSPGVYGATIGGGGALWYFGNSYSNRVDADFATIVGGLDNTIQFNAHSSAIGGGGANLIWVHASYSTIGGGSRNTIQTGAEFSSIVGGERNTIQTNAFYATIGGGATNTIDHSAFYATVGGGFENVIQTNAQYATIPGGRSNTGTNYAFAAGRRAKANHTGAFVWADSTDANFTSDRANQFKVRAGGGVYLQASSSGLNPAALRVESTTANGVVIHANQTSSDSTTVFVNRGAGDLIKGFSGVSGGNLVFQVQNDGDVFAQSYNPISDRNAKENFSSVNPQQVLAKVAALPISEWNFKGDDVRHVGPMAQDFHAAFGVGPDDKHIATVDADGVALAAIQGLNQKFTEELKRRDAENAELREELREIRQLLASRIHNNIRP